MRTPFIIFGLLTIFVASGCASREARFENIVPGMSTEEVRKTMKGGPTRFEEVAQTEFTAWYWGEDQCVLFKGGKAVAKDSSQIGQSVKVGPGQYEEKRQALCLAPGKVAEGTTERIVNIPGIGRIKLPKSLPFPKPREEQN